MRFIYNSNKNDFHRKFKYIPLCFQEKSYGYKTAWLSIITTNVMMLGSIEYTDNWVLPYTSGTMMYQGISFVMLIVFILLMPILLINLLVS